MENEVMRAFLNGFAALVTAFFREVAKHGLSIMLLTIISVFVWLRGERMEAKMEDKIAKINAECSTAINETNRRLQECERDKYDLSIRVAVLEFADRVRRGKLKR